MDSSASARPVYGRITMETASSVKSSAAPRVLVADPDPASRARNCESLSRAGCDVVEAADGREALVKALVRRPALVVTDLNLPFVDGVSLCEILRSDRMTADVPILVLTGEAERARIEQAKSAGADVVLPKETRLEDLLKEAGGLLMRSQTLRGRAGTARGRVSGELKKSAHLLEESAKHARPARSRQYQRFTTTKPPIEPPELHCPTCARTLRYEASHIGGVSADHAEQWDYYVCESCGAFRYRQRTRKLLKVG